MHNAVLIFHLRCEFELKLYNSHHPFFHLDINHWQIPVENFFISVLLKLLILFSIEIYQVSHVSLYQIFIVGWLPKFVPICFRNLILFLLSFSCLKIWAYLWILEKESHWIEIWVVKFFCRGVLISKGSDILLRYIGKDGSCS